MNFASDNTSGIAPEIMAALAAANMGGAMPYGADPGTRRLEAKLAELFEHEVAVFPVATGTAANALSLAALSPPWGLIFCHEGAHVASDEANAPEFYSAGAKLVPLAGEHGKLTAAALEAQLPGALGNVHRAQPSAVTISQATETGTTYRPAETAAICAVAHKHGLPVHMDGARFGNALSFAGGSPADHTWKAGIDALSFGATKNGALAAEAVIFFDPVWAKDLAFRRKRAGHLFSKMRFLAVQLEAYIDDGLWLRNAAHANAAAARLSQALAQLPNVELMFPVEANEIFVNMPQAMATGLLARGFQFYLQPGRVRLVTSFNTDDKVVDAFIAAARELA